MNPLRAVVFQLSIAGGLLAAESQPTIADQLLGRWESTSFATTNFDVFEGKETNLTLCVYEVEQQWTNATTKEFEAWLDLELRSRDREGRERIVSDSLGTAWVKGQYMLFGGPGGFGFAFSLTNGALRFEKSQDFTYKGRKHNLRVQAVLKKVSATPGERLIKRRVEPDASPNAAPPHR